MSEKCYYINEEIDFDCSSNNGYGSSSPIECDDCEEYFCSKHFKLHKKDGTCKKIQKGIEQENEEEMKSYLQEVPIALLENEILRRIKK